MTDREAIKRLENCAASPYMMAAIDLAISALQEREERSKGCEWCKDLANPQWKGQHLATIEGDSFCRKCGRPLKGELKWL